MSDNCSEKLLKAGDETPTGSVTKHGARRAEPGHTRLLLLTLMLCVCVCVTAFSCMCVLSVMFACVASITTDNTDLLVFTHYFWNTQEQQERSPRLSPIGP